MALPSAVAGGGHGGMLLTCRAGGAPLDLTGVSAIAGKIVDHADGTARAIVGGLVVAGDPTAGTIQWTHDAADLVAGYYLVQITISFTTGLPARSFADTWRVEPGY